MTETQPLLDIRDLSVRYASHGRRERGHPARAVDGVSFQLRHGETLGLVGESGSGKTTIGNTILGLVKPASGQIIFEGKDISRVAAHARRSLCKHIQVVFQDPYSSLNPSRTIGQTLADPLLLGWRTRKEDVAERVTDLLAQVGFPSEVANRYPEQFSGGQRQRIAIARALAPGPRLVVCDEPTSALDLSVQAQILNLLLDLQEKFGMSYLFISHDLNVVRHISHRIAVLRNGQLVESGSAEEITSAPRHPYTQALLDAVPVTDPRQQATRRHRRTQAADSRAPLAERAVLSGTAIADAEDAGP